MEAFTFPTLKEARGPAFFALVPLIGLVWIAYMLARHPRPLTWGGALALLVVVGGLIVITLACSHGLLWRVHYAVNAAGVSAQPVGWLARPPPRAWAWSEVHDVEVQRVVLLMGRAVYHVVIRTADQANPVLFAADDAESAEAVRARIESLRRAPSSR